MPDQVDDGILADFQAYLETETLLTKPWRQYRETITQWHRAVDQVDGWPLTHLAVPPPRRGYCLDWAALPQPLRDDTERWLARLAGDDLLADDGPTRPARPETIKHHRFQVRQLVSALQLLRTGLARGAGRRRPTR